MDLRQLRYLIQVAETGSFSKAAVQLNVAQPVLSRQIQLLEQELGVPLFRRTGRGAEPTEAGREFLGRAIHVMQFLLETREAISAYRDEVQGEVKVGVLPMFGAAMVPLLLVRCQQMYPHIKVRVEVGMSAIVQEWLISGRIDVGTVTYTDDISKALKTRDIFMSALYLVAKTGDGGPTGPASFEEAAAAAVVLPGKTNGVRKILDSTAAQRGLTLQPKIEVDSVEIIKGLLLQGIGATIMPRFPLRREIDAGLFSYREIPSLKTHYHIQLATSIESPPTKSTGVVADLIAAIGAELVAQQV